MPMDAVVFESVIDVRLEQSSNALFPIVTTELPMFTVCKDAQSMKALSPMVSTEFGIVMEVRDVHVSNEHSSMVVTELPIVTV